MCQDLGPLVLPQLELARQAGHARAASDDPLYHRRVARTQFAWLPADRPRRGRGHLLRRNVRTSTSILLKRASRQENEDGPCDRRADQGNERAIAEQLANQSLEERLDRKSVVEGKRGAR